MTCRGVRSRVVGGAFVLAACGAAVAGPIGPDVIVGDIAGNNDILTFGPVNGLRAYAFQTVSCNIGDEPALWVDFGTAEQRNKHPVIAQNMFRLADGRFEQLGQSWLKHGFCAINEALCESCPPENWTDCNSLAVACSDPYTAALNAGGQLYLGPKSDVNAATGYFPYASDGICPWCPLPTLDAIDRRMQVRVEDVDPDLNPGARYFFESQYVTPDDSAAGNGANNVSWREVTIEAGSFLAVTVGATVREQPAVFAWVSDDPNVTLTEIMVPDDGGAGFPGRFWFAARATDLGGGLWHYEYDVQNLTSDRSARGLTVPIPAGAQVNNIGFHDVDYHSGEPYALTDWPSSVGATSVDWATETFAANPNANALRWGTLYNFRFDADVAPTDSGIVELHLFKPGSFESMMVTTIVPNAEPGCACPGDMDGDGGVNGADIRLFVEMFLGTAPVEACADVSAPKGGALDFADLSGFVTRLLALLPCSCDCPGDLNASGDVNGADITPFVRMYVGDLPVNACADLADAIGGPLDSNDLVAFVTVLLGGPVCP